MMLNTKRKAWRHVGERDKEPLHYTDCGLDDVYLLSGYEVHDTPHGEGISVKNLDQLHVAIGCYLASKRKVLASKELRFMRKQMDLTQTELGRLLGLTSQQVARWEKGESEISGAADVLIRALFIQHAGNELDLKALVSSLDEIDALVSEKSFFEETSNGWRALKAA